MQGAKLSSGQGKDDEAGGGGAAGGGGRRFREVQLQEPIRLVSGLLSVRRRQGEGWCETESVWCQAWALGGLM